MLPGGGEVVVRSADNPDSLRGEGLDLVVPDECGFMAEAAWAEALRPALSDRKGKAIFISTPKGRNWFWRMWMTGQDEQHQDYMSWQYPTSDNPYIDPDEIEAARRTLPERVFQQEYLAEFIDDAGGVFRRIMDAATATERDYWDDELTEEREKEGLPARQLVAGVDVATMVDFTVVSVFDSVSKEQVYLDRFNRCDFSVLEDRLTALYERFNLDTMTIEQNSIGQSVIEALVDRGLSIIPFLTTSVSKQAAIQDLQAALEHSEITILNDLVQINELQSFEGERTPSGAWKYGAPEGMHDDTVMAMAICWHGIANEPWFIA
jgi:hypothetical protein